MREDNAGRLWGDDFVLDYWGIVEVARCRACNISPAPVQIPRRAASFWLYREAHALSPNISPFLPRIDKE